MRMETFNYLRKKKVKKGKERFILTREHHPAHVIIFSCSTSEEHDYSSTVKKQDSVQDTRGHTSPRHICIIQ
jgi:Fe2+ or Zn2+ uptake regulation protein